MMGLQYGFNEIHHHGVYVNDSKNVMLEYKIFHTNVSEPTHLLITNLRTGDTDGPYTLGRVGDDFNIQEEAKEVLENYASEFERYVR